MEATQLKIEIIGVPIDLGAGRRGVDMGPSAIRIAGLSAHLLRMGHEVVDSGDISIISPEVQVIDNPKLKYLNEIVRAVNQHTMEEMRSIFGNRCEVVADYDKIHARQEFHSTMDDVLETLRRRPCTIDDLANGMSLHRNEVIKYIQELLDKKLIRMEKRGEKVFYL